MKELCFLFSSDFDFKAEGGRQSSANVPKPVSIKAEKLCGFEDTNPGSVDDDEPAASPDPDDVTNAHDDAPADDVTNVPSDAENGGKTHW